MMIADFSFYRTLSKRRTVVSVSILRRMDTIPRTWVLSHPSKVLEMEVSEDDVCTYCMAEIDENNAVIRPVYFPNEFIMYISRIVYFY